MFGILLLTKHMVFDNQESKNLISYLPGNGNYSVEGAMHGGTQ